MAQESKAVDLGKLQDGVRFAKAAHKSALTHYQNASQKVQEAQARMDRAREQCEAANSALDKAKKAVLDGARSVAQG